MPVGPPSFPVRVGAPVGVSAVDGGNGPTIPWGRMAPREVAPPSRAPTSTAAAVPIAEDDAHRVYSPSDGDVTPPVLLRRGLAPDDPSDSPTADTGQFEVIVTERGTVEQVRLLKQEASYRGRMLLAVIKAWQFVPAQRDGRPVRYRMRVPVRWPTPEFPQ